jgi:hypothetical protein
MASNDTPKEQPGPTVTVEALSRAFSDALVSVQPKARITVANRVPRNPLNPTNEVRKFERDFYQNFTKVDPQDLLHDEYVLIPKLREGSFVPDGKEGYLFEVVDVKRGSYRGIHLRYSNGTQDQRMQLMVKAGPDLTSMLKTILADADKQKVEARAKRRAEED